jgi:hypothetical protein
MSLIIHRCHVQITVKESGHLQVCSVSFLCNFPPIHSITEFQFKSSICRSEAQNSFCLLHESVLGSTTMIYTLPGFPSVFANRSCDLISKTTGSAKCSYYSQYKPQTFRLLTKLSHAYDCHPASRKP